MNTRRPTTCAQQRTPLQRVPVAFDAFPLVDIVGRQDEAAAVQADDEAAFDLVADTTDTAFAFVRFEIDGGGNRRLENPDTSVPGSVPHDAGVTMWPPPAELGDFNDNVGTYASGVLILEAVAEGARP